MPDHFLSSMVRVCRLRLRLLLQGLCFSWQPEVLQAHRGMESSRRWHGPESAKNGCLPNSETYGSCRIRHPFDTEVEGSPPGHGK